MLYIRKSSGEKQRFNLHKFRRSLLKAGAQEKDIPTIIRRLQKEKPKSTARIHEIATQILQEINPPVADRYNLKRALMQLGPHGYSFEKFVAHLFTLEGYKTTTNQIIPGACIDHEIDVIAQKKSDHAMLECKFHNRIGMKSDVKVTLYVQARFEDIRDRWQQEEVEANEYHSAWVVTNTQFTSEAIKYGVCKEIKLLGWGYPTRRSLGYLIQKYDLFPITTLTSLSTAQKRTFLKKGLVLCKEARSHTKTLQKLGLKPQEIQKIIAEAEAVCKLPER